MLEQVDLCGYTVIGDKGLSGAEIEELVAALGGAFLRPDRRDEAPRLRNLGAIRQWIEAIIDQLKDQLSLERHGAHTIRRAWRAGRPAAARPRRLRLAQLADLEAASSRPRAAA